jgi:Mg-chelatase subunit ChlD
MSIFRRWAFWRRVQYGAGFLLIVLLIGLGVYRGYIYDPGNCFDSEMNQTERGVDCGGTCVRICTADVSTPRVVWAESFLVAEGQYNAVGYIENNNLTSGTPALSYRFEFFAGSEKVGERVGTTVLPPRSQYPVFEGRIISDKPITRTTLTLEPAELWLPVSTGREQFKNVSVLLEQVDTDPRLLVTLENTALTEAKNVEVVATLFNENGTPITASQTFVESLNPRSTRDIVFTWPNPLSKTIKTCDIPTDVVLAIDLSGSMNNDGGTPPQPVTAALVAAEQFARELKPVDQSAIVRFASSAETVTTLSPDHQSTGSTIRALTIRPADERGYTNTQAALRAADAELLSERHNKNARRAVVLLTDGLPTAASNDAFVAETIATASALKDAGLSIYAIGLGSGADAAFIEAVASGADYSYMAPSTKDLKAIYEQITRTLCESGTTKIEVIAKTGVNFAPLR